MRAEWIPWSAAALVTGAMALVMSQFIAPTLGDQGTAQMLRIADAKSGQWITMSMLWALSSAGFILGIPSVLTLFGRRGRILGSAACVVLAIGSLGLSGLAGLALIVHALAELKVPADTVETVLADPGLLILASVWIFGLFTGFILLAVALLRARSIPVWIPVLLVGFVAVQLALDGFMLVQRVGYLALAISFTGMAVHAVEPARQRVDAGTG